MADEGKVPTIVLKLTDPVIFNVEAEIELDKLPLMRVMLLEALRTVESLIEDQGAIDFQHKIQQLARATAAMQKGPPRKM